MSRTVQLHIGLAKSGTTYLQRTLQANRPLLAEHGVLLPGPKMAAHFKAALDLTGAALGGAQPEGTEGAWGRVVAAANQHDGTCLISHEMLALSSADTIRSAVHSFDTDDVRVVITARDFGRQVPAVWQERIKNGSEERFTEFLEMLFSSPQGSKHRGAFWKMQYLIDISDRWAGVVGADRLTVATVPPAGGDPAELWRRFVVAAGLPDLDYAAAAGGRNPSLGVVESELLRRLNGHLPELPWAQYVKQVKHGFAEQTLAAASTSERLTVPRHYQDEVSRISQLTVEHLAASGCRVVGDLAELVPDFPERDPATPDAVSEDDVLRLALAQLGERLVREPTPKAAAPAQAPPENARPKAKATARPSRRRSLAALKARLRGS